MWKIWDDWSRRDLLSSWFVNRARQRVGNINNKSTQLHRESAQKVWNGELQTCLYSSWAWKKVYAVIFTWWALWYSDLSTGNWMFDLHINSNQTRYHCSRWSLVPIYVKAKQRPLDGWETCSTITQRNFELCSEILCSCWANRIKWLQWCKLGRRCWHSNINIRLCISVWKWYHQLVQQKTTHSY